MGKKTLFLNLITLIFIGFAAERSFADRSLENQLIYRSPNALAKGSTGIADTDDHEAIFYNPAGLAQGDGLYKEIVLASPTVVVSSDAKNLVRKLSFEDDDSVQSLRQHVGKNQHISASNFTGFVFRRAALGAVVNTTNNVLISKDPDNNGIETLQANSYNTAAINLALAEKFLNERLFIGANLKYVNRTEAELELNVVDSEGFSDQLESDEIQKQFTGTGADLGLMYRIPARTTTTFGLRIANVGGLSLVNQQQGGQNRILAQTIDLGVSFNFSTKLSSMKFNFDLVDIAGAAEENMFKKIHFGTELKFKNFFGFAGGINQGYGSAGFFVNLYLVRFDLGTYTHEVGSHIGVRPDERYFFRVRVAL